MQKSRKSATTSQNKQTNKQANKEKMRRRQGESCESQRANKKKAKQLQGEEIKKRASNKDKHTTKITSQQGEDEETTRRFVGEPAGKQEEGKATTRRRD